MPPTVIVSPQGEPLIRDSLRQARLEAHLVIQPEPLGMGDAVLRFECSPVASEATHVLLAWGDLACLQANTVSCMATSHIKCGNDFTFVTRIVDDAYTVVKRDHAGRVLCVSETREQGVTILGLVNARLDCSRLEGAYFFNHPFQASLAQGLASMVFSMQLSIWLEEAQRLTPSQLPPSWI